VHNYSDLTIFKVMKKILIVLLILLIAFMAGVIGLNQFFKNKIIYFLDNALANNIELKYDAIHVDSWGGGVTLEDAFLIIKKRGDTLVNTKIRTGKISFSGLSYWDYFVKNRVHIEEIHVDDNSIWFLDDPSNESKNTTGGPINLGKEINIDRLAIGNTTLKILKPEKDSLFLQVARASFTIEDIRIDRDIVRRKIPLNYSDMLFEADSLFLKMNPYDNLTIGSVRLQKEDVILANTKISTKYSKEGLSRKINIERDHIDLQIPELGIHKIAWGFIQDTLFTKAALMRIKQPKLAIYRDKLVADDETIKPIYSKILRNVPFNLMLDSLTVEDAAIVYREKVKEEQPAGEIRFSQLEIQGANLGNTYKIGADTTKLAIKGIFLDTAPLQIDWSFDVQNPKDVFTLKGFMGEMTAANINSFTEPNLRAKMTGKVERVYFNINGDNYQSNIDMKMKYNDFKIAILNKDSKKNKFFSAIANLFVSSNSLDKDSGEYRSGRGHADRDMTKSFFNYLWLNLKDGLIKVLLGNGKK